MEKPEKQTRKISPLVVALGYLLVLLVAQLTALWVAGKIFPAVPCGPFADKPCTPYPTTEGLMFGALLPLIFLPFAFMQFKQIVMYAGALVPYKKLLVLLASVGVLILMLWQCVAGLGALLGRWFG